MARSHLLKALQPARVAGRRRRHGGRHGHGRSHTNTNSNSNTGTGTRTRTRSHG